MISIIVAIAENRAIGSENKLIYWLPNDLKRFKALTTGNTIIMGRRTFESLPKGALPNRRNIVLSRKGKPEDFPGADLFPSLVSSSRLYAHPIPPPLLDMGTPSGLSALSAYLSR